MKLFHKPCPRYFIESMILIQETDISWMQLGRLYELQGKCLMAREAYGHVSMAPPTKDVPHATVLEQLIKYQKNYQDTCSATLILECQTDNMTITIDNDKAIPCSNEPIPVTPGAHTIQARTAYGSTILHLVSDIKFLPSLCKPAQRICQRSGR